MKVWTLVESQEQDSELSCKHWRTPNNYFPEMHTTFEMIVNLLRILEVEDTVNVRFNARRRDPILTRIRVPA